MTAPAVTPAKPVEFKNGQFQFVQGDATWLRLRKLAKTDLYWLASVVLGYGEVVPMLEHTHRALCRVAEGRTGCAAIDEAHVQRLELPRDWGKTTSITQSLPIQMLCNDPTMSILLANEKEGNAKKFLAAIKWHFTDNDFFRALFPELIPANTNDVLWSATEIAVGNSGRKEPSIFATGVGGTVTGMHPNVIIVDDMISRAAMENARAGSNEIMAQTNRWINQLRPLVQKRNDPRWRIYFIGTRWWIGDSYDHISKAYGYGEQEKTYALRTPLPSGEVQVLHASVAGDLVTFKRAAIEHGRSTFIEKWTLEDLARMRMVDEALFACNMMNNPADDATATFKATWLQTHTLVDDRSIMYTSGEGKKRLKEITDLDVLFLVDPGGFAARRTEDRARPAVVVVGDDRAGMYHLLDIYNEKDTFLAAIKQIVAWITKYAPRKIYVERAGQQAAFAQLLREEIRKAGLTTVVDDTTLKPGVTQKEVRILALEPYFQRGQFTIGTGAAFHTFREQYTQFPRTARIDVLDVLAYLPRIVKPRVGAGQHRDTQARQDAERATYRARRGVR